MPYIKQEDRGWLKTSIEHITHDMARMIDKGPGVLNYVLTRIVIAWLGNKPNYERYNAAIGVLECAKQELYRRQIALYEDTKIRLNGDVYDDTPWGER